MTERLYYTDSFLAEFDAEVVDVIENSGSPMAVVLDRSAFYPESGGQPFDTGSLVVDGAQKISITEVQEDKHGGVLHYLEAGAKLQKGTRVRGIIDFERRHDHMQQHSGQHLLSAAFVRLFETPTVSFHLGADFSTIDLAAKALTHGQIEKAQELANSVVTEDRPVQVRVVSLEEALALGVRKLPPLEREQLRLIDIRDFDLTACGGTHVHSTGQIGPVLLRKTEKVKPGLRVEFVCGNRAVTAAGHDYQTLSESAGILSTHISEVPQQIRKVLDEARALHKQQHLLLEELAEFHAARLLSEAPENAGFKLVQKIFADRKLGFVKVLAQKLTRNPSAAVVALLASTDEQCSLVFAQSPGFRFDMGTLMKEAAAKLGGRGGGSKDMAQGGAPDASLLGAVLADLINRLRAMH